MTLCGRQLSNKRIFNRSLKFYLLETVINVLGVRFWGLFYIMSIMIDIFFTIVKINNQKNVRSELIMLIM